ncbi:MAG: FtsX-like permease family protein [Imperialibacter sp.]|uniref:ABC transporter permease n=1 Tax=Imperialibacter sp. TaxID=2038411 RepID=UPI0032EDE8A0
MLTNFLKSALRNSLRHRGYTLINVLGLSVGLGVFLILMFYIRYEQSFNLYHSKADKIYRIVESGTTPEAGEVKTIFTNWAMGGALKAEFPEVEDITRVFIFGGAMHSVGEKKFLERNYYVVEKSYFDVFDHRFTAGSITQDVGNNGVDLILTHSAAKKYFGTENPVGKMIDSDRFGSCKVVAVVEDVPKNSSFQPDFFYLADIKMWSENYQRYFASWEPRNCGTFLVLNDQSAVASIMQKKEAFLKDNMGEQWETRDFELQPFTDVHLRSVDIDTPTQHAKGNQQYIIIFGLIAVFVLVIAVINYINLATARAIFRRKEVGIRKVVGASKGQLISQFLVESILVSTVALIAALGLIELALPWFNSLTERTIEIPYLQQPSILVAIFCVSAITGIFSGLVPAFIISAYQPGQVLGGHFQKVGNLISRKVLVVFQFSLSIVLIIATAVVYNQMDYVQNRDMGFDKERKMVIDINSGNVRRSFRAMKSEFASHPDVLNVAAVSRVPGEWKSLPAVSVTKTAGEEPQLMRFMGFDPDALETFDIKLKVGNNFSGNDQLDSLHVLLNEKAAAMLGGEGIVGERIQFHDGEESITFQVVGIVENFNFESLYQEIGPMVIGPWNNVIMSIDYFVLNTKGDPSNVLEHASAVHDKFAPEGSIEYNFLDQQWERYYRDDIKRGTVFALAAGLAILIACLGLLGLASFATSLRLKEFGIRKVLGASNQQLVYLISKEFLLLVLIGFALGSPLAYWLMDKWLSSFAYAEGLSISTFVVTGLAVALIALLTVGYKSLQAARRNPTASLRNE